VLGWLLILWRFIAIFSWMGAPLYTFDLLKNGDEDLKAIVFCTVPIALMVIGSLGFNFEKRGRFLVRIGLFGAVSALLLNAFATICHLFYWPGYRNELLLIAGLVAGFVASLSYLLLSRTYLSRPR
jgi:hypothetical protein